MKKQVLQFTVVLAVLITSRSWAGGVADDFEDGNITHNPTWIIKVDQFGTEFGEGYVAADPVRAGNHAFKAHGATTAHYEITTYLNSGIPWADFDVSAEFLATAWNFHWQTNILNDNQRFSFSAWYDSTRGPGAQDYVVLGIRENSESWNYTLIPKASISLNQWYRMHSWYDECAGLLKSELRTWSTDTLIDTVSGAPVADIAQLPPIDRASIGIEETNWQYVDNVLLTSMPGVPCENDDCINELPVQLNAPYQGSTAEATGLSTSSCGYKDTLDVWHSFAAEVTGEYTISLCGSTFDTTLSIFDECDGTELACNDDTPEGVCSHTVLSQLDMQMERGQDYYIRIAGHNGQSGDYTLTVTGPVCTAPIKGDMNGDCKIDFKDLADILSRWLECNLEPEELCWE